MVAAENALLWEDVRHRSPGVPSPIRRSAFHFGKALLVLGVTLSGCAPGDDPFAAQNGTIVVNVATRTLLDEAHSGGPAPSGPFTAYVREIKTFRINERPVDLNGSATFGNLGVGFDLGAGVKDLPHNCEGPLEETTVRLGRAETREVSVSVTCFLPNTGTIEVRVLGLPSGAVPQVSISGPSLEDVAVTQQGTTVFSDIRSGYYMVSAGPVQAGGESYHPHEDEQFRYVTAGSTGVITVLYATAPGELNVQIGGLPTGLSASVMVTGPGGFSRNLNWSTLMRDLAPGSYTINANTVLSADGLITWVPSPISQTVHVASGETRSATVVYDSVSATGEMEVTILGLPEGVAADVVVTHPDGTSTALTGSQVLGDLLPGVHGIAAAPVEDAESRFEPEFPAFEVVVESGATASAEVPYFTLTGNLLVDPGFEEGLHSVGSPVIPSETGAWHGDLSFLKGAENGITPAEGSTMLRCDATGPFGAGAGSTGCEIYQILDVSSYAEVIDGGTASAIGDALFNRVVGDGETDRGFIVDVYGFTGDAASVRTGISALGWAARGFLSLTTDADLGTWEQQKVVVALPAGTRTLVLRLVAAEDVKDDATLPEFDGHYMDDAHLILRYRQ